MMISRTVLAACVLSCVLALPVASPAQTGLPSGMALPSGGFSKEALLEQAKSLLSELTSMKSSGKLPAEQTKKVDELLPKARSLNDELSKPQVSTSRLPQLASNLNDLQKQVGVLKGFMR
jgi:polyhydroxyalkanoate synthesis regulator phasin